MLKMTKLFAIVAMFATAVINISACTKDNPEPEKVSIASNAAGSSGNVSENNNSGSERPEIKPQVLTIESVSKAVKGKAVDFTWKEGETVKSFSEYTKNKVVFLNFWATWCAPCRMEIPDIVKISNKLAGKDFVVVGVNLDTRGTLEQVKKMVEDFTKSNNIPYKNFLITQNLTEPYGGVNSIPTSFIIDKQGNIVETILGMRSEDAFMKSINRVLK